MTALPFPASPGTDQTFHRWRWDGEKWVVTTGWLPLTGGTLGPGAGGTGSLAFTGPRDIFGLSNGEAFWWDDANWDWIPVETPRGVNRWRILLGDDTPELGGNTGSNFVIQHFNDDGSWLANPMIIRRSDGVVTMPGGVYIRWPLAGILFQDFTGQLRVLTPLGHGFDLSGQLGIDLPLRILDEAANAVACYESEQTPGSLVVHFQSAPPNLHAPVDQRANMIAAGKGPLTDWQSHRCRIYLRINPQTGGPDRGSDFKITQLSNAPGGWVRDPLTITRWNGAITLTAPYVVVSDAALKEDVQPLAGASDKVARLHGVHYRHKQTKEHAFGLIAQEVQEVAPEIVRKTGDHLGVSYEQLVPVLIEAVKELTAEVETIKRDRKARIMREKEMK